LEEGMTPILTGGPSDIEEEQEIQNLIGAPVPSIVGKCKLMQLAAIMERADLLVTGDTGPMHIAAAMELPIVALFGPANPVRTGPYAPDSIVFQKPRDCQPCYARHCKFGEEPPPCLLDITVEEVVGEIQKALSKAPSMME
ncbi:MAG: glycosyltransferase family 9 protein, partial [Candidatus Omnitrophica bacterium]|nr:glycosyltransferase family 9 protein [Candidatus Omnitrophota bacterium]